MSTFTAIYNFVTYTASGFSVMMNVSPLLTIRRLEQSGTVGASTITFYGAQMYSAITWASYGVFSTSYPLLISNTLGNAVSTYCSLVFLAVARREEKSGRTLQSTTYSKSVMTYVFFFLLCAAHLLLSIIIIISGRPEAAKTITGYEGCVAIIVMLSSPLMAFKHIVVTKNAEVLAPAMVGCAFFNSLFWLIAGLMTGDAFIVAPNVPCLLACCVQVALLVIYGRRPTAPKEMREGIAPTPFG
ncbi:Sugar efflux transporter for intercellular exchange, putative [Leishmania lindenbergi]|uniref:Sugar transporter SWEET1 n=1 Tax=Leishmania lindenbergi TaxID=651832 RepID=A0AAW3A8X1_9TRYP